MATEELVQAEESACTVDPVHGLLQGTCESVGLMDIVAGLGIIALMLVALLGVSLKPLHERQKPKKSVGAKLPHRPNDPNFPNRRD